MGATHEQSQLQTQRSGSFGGASRRRFVAGFFVILAAVAIGSTIRIHTALTDANFNTNDARPMLRSDPALLYYITEEIVESGGRPPADFRHDPRIEYPDTCDIPVMFTVGQEFLIAWCYLLFGQGVPLHVFCVWVMGIFASLAAVGVFGLAFELTRRVGWATLAVALYLILAANYRTIGFILIREDFSLPFFALHLYLLARSVRLRTPTSYILAALSAVAALATWHAMRFVITLEMLCIFAWVLRTGLNPLAARRAWLIPATMAAAALVIPVLRGKWFLTSLPMLVLYVLLLAAPLARRWNWSRWTNRLALVAGLCVLLAARVAIARIAGAGETDYSHVLALVKAKILNFGILPADPTTIPFDARLLWQGPFKTAGAQALFGELGIGLLLILTALVLGLRAWWTGREENRIAVLWTFVVVTAISAYFVARTIILPGLVAPVAGVVALRAIRFKSLRIGLVALGVVAQVVIFSARLRSYYVSWYEPRRSAELLRLVDWIEQYAPSGEPIAADFVNSTAILAHTRHPIMLQPKYETTRSRRRIEEFMMTFVHGSPAEFRAMLLRRQFHYVLVDRSYMWAGAQYLTGIAPGPNNAPAPGTAAWMFCNSDRRVYGAVAGYRLLYHSPRYRLYRLE